MVPDSSIQHLSDHAQQAARAAKHDLERPYSTTIPRKASYASTLQSQYGIKSREELLNELQSHGITYDPETLRHSHYVTGVKNDMSDDVDYTHILRAATQLPFTSTDRLPAQLATLKDVAVTSGSFGSTYRGANADELPRSVQKALHIIRGENLLEPGTRANRLFNKVYNNKTLWNKLKLTGNFQQYIDGKNAGYNPEIDAMLISKAMADMGAEAHETGHRIAHIMPPEEHADTAFRTFRKMQLLGDKHGFRAPLDSSRLMQEAFAESYVPKLLGPNSWMRRYISPERRVQHFLEFVGGGPEYNYKDLLEGVSNGHKMAEDIISAMQATEDTKNLFRQLAYNYGLASKDALPIDTFGIPL